MQDILLKWDHIINHQSLNYAIKKLLKNCFPRINNKNTLNIMIHEQEFNKKYEEYNLRQLQNAIFQVTKKNVVCEYLIVKDKYDIEKHDLETSFKFALNSLDYITKNDFQSQDLLKRSNEDYFIDTVRGKLSEIIFKKFYENIEKGYTFEIDTKIYKSTIETDNGNDMAIIYKVDNPKMKFFNNSKVDIKASKANAQWLLVEKKKSFSDIYVLIKLNFENEDYLKRGTINLELIKDEENKNRLLKGLLDTFTNQYDGKVAGFAFNSDIIDPITNKPWLEFRREHGLISPHEIPRFFVQDPERLGALFNQYNNKMRKFLLETKAESNYAIPAGYLRNSFEDWMIFLNIIRTNSVVMENSIFHKRFPQMMSNRTSTGIEERVQEVNEFYTNIENEY